MTIRTSQYKCHFQGQTKLRRLFDTITGHVVLIQPRENELGLYDFNAIYLLHI